MARTATKGTVKNATIADMKKLGVYKPQYNRIIDIYAELVSQYLTLTKEFEEGGYKYEVETMQGGSKKSPIVATLETLRKDILAYSDRLCLNPKALESVTVEKAGKSTLAKVLSELQ
ncbi:P27 family phage terminase small subunit [Aminipila luticellarii]|uniref:P27 family phage terminase small subunit n=1 Tax=Aminipila luticellarii TaxID=2507160 RepID=A0A410PWY3_9FIRM|nr:P27 family phage terminase small subunit [Aminipila luticellarii]QAT43449.1 P27 family phage terminase small subunit [Aminipila luticellarii]